jgi:23S rRNA (uracil1939-C5)-methyltransferase
MSGIEAAITIDRLGESGDGVARAPSGLVFVPYALAGETVVVEIDAGRGKLIGIVTPSPDRIPPFCPYFTRCGGCAVQTLAAPAYRQWKRDLVVSALRRAGLAAKVLDLVNAHGDGRRRATFHVRYLDGRPTAGFMQSRAHQVIEIESCPLLSPSLAHAMAVACAIGAALAASRKSLDILVNAAASGLDVDIKGHGPLDERQRQALVRTALAHDLARLSNHGEVLLTKRTPIIAIGKAAVALPPGAFLQATAAGEEALATRVCALAARAKRVVDLFSGIGTFALRVAEFAAVHAFDIDAEALAALAKAAAAAPLREVVTARRNLSRHPLTPNELEIFDAALFDPPRAGAESQARALAASSVPLVIGISCNAKTFARDAAILCAGGLELMQVEPIDQFRHTPHVEIIACFRRHASRMRKKRSILG